MNPAREGEAGFKNASNVDKYVPPDLLGHTPSAIKAWADIRGSNGTIRASHRIASVSKGPTRTPGPYNPYTVRLSISMANTNYIVLGVAPYDVTTTEFKYDSHQAGDRQLAVIGDIA